MKRLAILAILALFVAATVVLVWPAVAADKVPPVKEIMGKLNKPGGLRPNLGQDLMADEPDWDEIQKEAKEFAALASALGKNTPPVGDKGSWDRLTAAYAADAAALEAAALKKDKKATLAVHGKLSAMGLCKNCHDAHQKK
jgi:cytochrome c553